jgi:hypothetical protein
MLHQQLSHRMKFVWLRLEAALCDLYGNVKMCVHSTASSFFPLFNYFLMLIEDAAKWVVGQRQQRMQNCWQALKSGLC